MSEDVEAAKEWDIRYTARDGERVWFDQMMTESTAREYVDLMTTGALGDEFGNPEAVNRVEDLKNRYPIGARIIWHHGTGTVLEGHRIFRHFNKPTETLHVHMDDGITSEVVATFVTLAPQ
ncbi:hypothetical protein [Nocardia wallacei]|uniref:hypothetical protein n=1 Tax=Nocardia wallacei TaxID=480035 RepID=UPI0024543076|nr:hypothetical protein [Nocardia wallacei]